MPATTVVIKVDDSEIQKAVEKGQTIGKKETAPGGKFAAVRGAAEPAAKKTEFMDKVSRSVLTPLSAAAKQFLGLAAIVGPAVVLAKVFSLMSQVSGPFVAVMAKFQVFLIKVAQILGDVIAPLLDIFVSEFETWIPLISILANAFKFLINILSTQADNLSDGIGVLNKAIIFAVQGIEFLGNVLRWAVGAIVNIILGQKVPAFNVVANLPLTQLVKDALAGKDALPPVQALPFPGVFTKPPEIPDPKIPPRDIAPPPKTELSENSIFSDEGIVASLNEVKNVIEKQGRQTLISKQEIMTVSIGELA